jgi:hypothetical protein
MQLELLERLDCENLACSLYRRAEGEYTIWLKVGVALLEIPEEMLDDTIAILRGIQTSIYLKENPE